MWFCSIRQILFQLRSQPLLSTINVLGTALAVCIIMIVVMMQEVKTASFPPESYRDRMLYVQWMQLTNKKTGEAASSCGFVSETVAKECFLNLKTPEAVSLYASLETLPVALPKQAAQFVDVRGTDAAFWKVFNFTFIDGIPYNEADAQAGRWYVVITERLAQSLFGEIKVSGKEIRVAGYPYRVVGVVKDVSTLASTAYAQMWLPYRALGIQQEMWDNGMIGSLLVAILAHKRSDFPVIRKECEQLRKKFSASLGEKELNYAHQPDEQEKASLRFVQQDEPDMTLLRNRRYLVFLVLLLIPAINLSSMTQSRFRQRMEEIGVRRALGATRWSIMMQVLAENFMVTLFAGILGLLLCMLFSMWGSEFLFGASALGAPLRQEMTIHWQLLLRPSVFGYTLLFCFLLNLLSSGIPAWRTSRCSIVKALGGFMK